MKIIGSNKYIHKSNIKALSSEEIELLNNSEYILYKNIGLVDYSIVKVNKKDNSVSFIICDDFDTSQEPTVGDSYKVDLLSNSIKASKKKENNPQIYHHKWKFVNDNYKGFDVDESKEWSKLWESVLPRSREVKSRIGYKNYWNDILKKYNLL